MRKRLSIKGGIFLLAVLSLIAIGVVYAVEIERGISGSVIIGQVQTAEETILLYAQVDPRVALTELRFDPVNISAFGRFKSPSRVSFLAQNGGDAPFYLTVELTDLKLNGAPLPDALSMLMGAAGGGLQASPNHETLMQPGELVALDVGLRFHKSPAELGLDSGDVITFTALFMAAEGPVEQPVSYSAGEAPVPKVGKHVDAIALSAEYGQDVRYGGTFLNGIFENFPHYDFQQGLGANIMAQSQIYNSLIMSHPFVVGEIMPDLAYAWEISPDGRTYTFHLHDGVKWHDGSPFSSEDVRYSFNRIMTKGVLPGFEQPTCPACRETVWVSLFEGVEAPDPNTVVINTKGASGSVLKVLMSSYVSIMPKHIIEADPVDGLKTERIPTGTGPFKVTKEPTTVLWEYVRNPDYFKPDLPYMDAMESHVIQD